MSQHENSQEITTLELNGCATVKELKKSCKIIPDCKGIYVVFRKNSDEMPRMLAAGPVSEHNGKALAYPKDFLEKKWVSGTRIVYIGKSDSSLRTRIRTYMNYGKGKDAPHRGGRAIWQLPDADELVIGWKTINSSLSARELEAKLISEFKGRNGGKLPFANITE